MKFLMEVDDEAGTIEVKSGDIGYFLVLADSNRGAQMSAAIGLLTQPLTSVLRSLEEAAASEPTDEEPEPDAP